MTPCGRRCAGAHCAGRKSPGCAETSPWLATIPVEGRDSGMDAAQWARLVEGTGCPMDAPRPSSNDYWDLVSPLSISSLYLNTNQAYRGHCMLILDRHAARLDQL